MTNEELVKRIQLNDNDKDSLLLLFNQNKGLIHKLASKYINGSETIEDFEQEAFLVMYESIKHYNFDDNMQFTTYFYQCLKWHYFRNKKTPVYIPDYIRELLLKYKRVEDAATKKGHTLTDAEIKRALGINAETLENLKKAQKEMFTTSLYAQIGDNEDILLIDNIEDATSCDAFYNVENELYNEQIKALIWNIVDELPQANIIHERFENNQTYKEIAEEIGKSPNYVSDACQRALRRLKAKKELERIALESEVYNKALKGSVKTFKRTGTSITEYIALGLVDGYF